LTVTLDQISNPPPKLKGLMNLSLLSVNPGKEVEKHQQEHEEYEGEGEDTGRGEEAEEAESEQNSQFSKN
jgi:hypothetical protein